MHASLRSVRIAPKKAQLVAKMIRGKSVPDAVHILERTNKKAARILEQLLRSAMANASHNEKQDAQMMVVKMLTVNKAQSYHRGVPMARGRVRPMRKFLSHISLKLGIAEDSSQTLKSQNSSLKSQKPTAQSKKEDKTPSKTPKKPVKKAQATKKTTKSSSSKSSKKKETAPKTSKSSKSKK